MTDFKVMKDNKEDLLNKTPIELVATDVLKFDILPSEVVWGTVVNISTNRVKLNISPPLYS